MRELPRSNVLCFYNGSAGELLYMAWAVGGLESNAQNKELQVKIWPQLFKERISRYPADKMYWLEYILSTIYPLDSIRSSNGAPTFFDQNCADET